MQIYRPRFRRSSSLAAGALVLIGLLVAPATAYGHSVAAPAGDPPGSSGVPEPTPEVLAAMQRDLHLTEAEARVQIAAQAAAPFIVDRLKVELGDRLGGAWIADGGQLMVGVTDPADAAVVRRPGPSRSPSSTAWRNSTRS